MYENILKGDSNRKIAEVARADIVVGIPTFKNARTVGRVIQTAGLGLAALSHLKPVIAIVDGGSSDDTMLQANAAPLPAGVRRITGLYPGLPGKGSGVRTVLEIARALRAKAVILLEADLLSLEPNWIQRLAVPILTREYDLALPLYTRALVDNAVTDLIAYPLTRALYGVDVRQPMGGEFAMSDDLANKIASRDVWETDVARHGFDIWLTTIAVNEAIRLCQVRLGEKLDYSRELSLALDPTYVQAIGTLFRMIDIYRRRWPEVTRVRPAPIYGESGGRRGPDPKGNSHTSPSVDVKLMAPPLSLEQLADAFRSGVRRYSRVWKTVLVPSHLRFVRALAERPDGAYRFPLELWVNSVLDFCVVYNKGEGDPDKSVAAMLPLYFARIATILKETGGDPDKIEQIIQQQADLFARSKGYLAQRWQTYVPWTFEGVR